VKAPDHFWRAGHPAAWILWPLSLIFGIAVWLRRFAYRHGWLETTRLPVPVLVIGNITVGGAGKTPLVAWAAARIGQMGLRPGVVLRGYGGKSATWPLAVSPDTDPGLAGDEAVLLARRTACPVVAGPDRVAAASRLVEEFGCDFVLSDDGLQHYALGRDLEVAVLDAGRMLGNRMLLPAGPLRERPGRLSSVDLVVINGAGEDGTACFRVVATDAVNLHTGERRPLSGFRGQPCHAVAGIGNPERFFATLREHDLAFDARWFPDHHCFVPEDLAFGDRQPVLMTEKDAVKCEGFALPYHWYVPVTARAGPRLEKEFTRLLAELVNGQKTA
jgi:tetraacyldisaccharide 4'-kinase